MKTLEDNLAQSLFKAGYSLIQSAIDHAAGQAGDIGQAKFFHRELEKKCRQLTTKLETAEIPLQVLDDSVISSRLG